MKKIDFSKYSSIKIGSVIEVKLIKEEQILPPNSFIIGGCNNILLGSNLPEIYMLDTCFDDISFCDEGIKVGAKTSSKKLLNFAKEHNLANFELLAKLPGTLGGIVKMNAGLKEYEIFNHLIKIRTNKGWIYKDDINFAYRYTDIKDIIYEVVFKQNSGFDANLLNLMKKYRDNQPKQPSCGSCFKNPKNEYAGALLEKARLKGYTKGGMGFSEKHSNFLVNLGSGTYDEAIYLINLAKKRVFESFGVELEEEIIIL